MKHREQNQQTVFVALSGGVDSAVAALLLKEKGIPIVGVYMENWQKTALTPHCTTEEDRRDALRVADHLGMPFRTMNFEKEYRATVLDYFYREYTAGRTPNPDVMCNTEIKFRAFLNAAIKKGATSIATGHYAQKSFFNGSWQLRKAADPNKDQTYFLHTLTQHRLQHALFPIGEMTKTEVRERASRAGLPVAEKPDSQGICFLGDVNIRELLHSQIRSHPGPVVTADGTVVGHHEGLSFSTIGQREGLGIGGSGVPYYVAKKIPETNTLVVAHGNQDPVLYKNFLVASQMHWVSGRSPTFPAKVKAAIRYRQTPQKAEIQEDRNGIRVLFEEPQRAITPGQSVVFYDGDICLGGAVIDE